MPAPADITRLRDLVSRYLAICAEPVQVTRRDLWRRHNSLKPTRPLIIVRAFAWGEMLEQNTLQCADPFFRSYENMLLSHLFRHTFEDDFIFEPWLRLQATHKSQGWGVEIKRHFSGEAHGSWKAEYPLKKLSDIDKLRPLEHRIDEEATAANLGKLQDAVGDLIPIHVDRAPAYRVWSGDISTDLGYLRGIEHFMMDMLDNPEWLHRLAGFMRDGILRTHEQAEAAGDWSLAEHENQSMPYAQDSEDPAPNTHGVSQKQLWGYMAAQEFTAVSPAMHDEFLLQYQLPILKNFGLTAYGCCEDLTHKIDMLRQIPNLRRIAVTPFADVARCAEQIGTDYVFSYRPSPTDMVGYGFAPERIIRILTDALNACRDCHVDITLKDVETVESDPDRIRRWVALTRKIADRIF